MCINVLPVCVDVESCMPGACGGQKRVSNVLGLELFQRVVSCYVGAENQTRAPCEINRCTYLLS